MQLVELQRTIHEAQGHQVAVLAISYDPVDVLAAFAEQHGVAYPLLADQGSVVIEALGLLNTQIVEERAFWGKPVEDRHRGLPFPGTFMLDRDGVVTDKVFARSHRIRHGGATLLARLGIDPVRIDQLATAHGPCVAVAAWVDTPDYFPNQVVRLIVRLAVEDGFHVYVPPNPSGYRNLAITVDAPGGVFLEPHELPTGHPFQVEGFSEEFTVAEGELEMVIPFYILEDFGEMSLPITVEYQACSATTCLPPDSVDLVVEVREIRA